MTHETPYNKSITASYVKVFDSEVPGIDEYFHIRDKHLKKFIEQDYTYLIIADTKYKIYFIRKIFFDNTLREDLDKIKQAFKRYGEENGKTTLKEDSDSLNATLWYQNNVNKKEIDHKYFLNTVNTKENIEIQIQKLSDTINRKRGENIIENMKALGEKGKLKAEHLVRNLNDHDKTVRSNSIAAIENIVEPALKPFVHALKNRDKTVRLNAIAALGKIGEPAVEPLIQALSDEESDVRNKARESLVRIRDARAVIPLIQSYIRYEDFHNPVAVHSLGGIGKPAIEPLIRVLEYFRDMGISGQLRSVRFEIIVIEALGEIEDARVIETLIKVFGYENPYIRQCAAAALSHQGKPAVEPLNQALKNENCYYREAAAEAFGIMRDTRAVEPLIKVLIEKDWFVMGAAAKALGKMGDVRAVEPLIQMIRNKDNGLSDAIEALEKIGDKRAVEPLIKILGDETSPHHHREKAARALGKIGDARAVEPLIKTLGDKNSNIRIEAQRALVKIGDARAVEPFIKELGDKNSNVRIEAAIILGDLGDARAVEPLTKAQEDWPTNLRKYVDEALEKIKAKANKSEPLGAV